MNQFETFKVIRDKIGVEAWCGIVECALSVACMELIAQALPEPLRKRLEWDSQLQKAKQLDADFLSMTYIERVVKTAERLVPK